MTQLEQQRTTEARGKVIYTAKTHTTGGRENGVSRSSDGRLDVKLSVPGSPHVGTNPEQLFAAGWSACFEGALGVAAHKRKSSSRPTWRSTPRSTSIWMVASTSSVPASTSPFPASNGASRRA